MGVYDEYGGVQLKVGPCVLARYEVGDTVPIPSGVYVGHGGVVVIVCGVFTAKFDRLTSKWGGVVQPGEVLIPHDYVAEAVSERKLLEACKAVLEWAWTDKDESTGTFGYFAETVVPLVDDAVKAAEGEETE